MDRDNNNEYLETKEFEEQIQRMNLNLETFGIRERI